MSTTSDLYVGTWELVPELCVYDDGAPPEHATYTIEREGAEVRILMSWRPSGSTDTHVGHFAGRPDGEVRPLPESPHLTGLSMTRVDERTLDTAAWDGDEVASSARRTASTDGTLLVVTQTTRRDDGPDLRSVQVYRRQPTERRTCSTGGATLSRPVRTGRARTPPAELARRAGHPDVLAEQLMARVEAP